MEDVVTVGPIYPDGSVGVGHRIILESTPTPNAAKLRRICLWYFRQEVSRARYPFSQACLLEFEDVHKNMF